MAKLSATRAKLLPAALGYRMPAEWEPHESTWLAWPHFRNDWPGKFEPIPWVYAEIVRNLARHERVDLIVNDASWEKRARTALEKAGACSRHFLLSPRAHRSRVAARPRLLLPAAARRSRRFWAPRSALSVQRL